MVEPQRYPQQDMSRLAVGAPKAGPQIADIKKWLLLALAACLFIWPKYITMGPAGIRMSPYNVLILVSMAFALLLAFAGNSRSRSIGSFGRAAIAIFVVYYLIKFSSDAMSSDRAGAFYWDVRDIIWISSTFLIAVMLGNRDESLREISLLIVIFMIIIVALAILELVLGQTLPALILQNIKIDIDPVFKSSLVFDKTRDGVFRAQSVFQHPIIFGEVMAASAPVILAYFISASRYRYLALFAFACAIGGVFLSGSRGSQAAFVVGIVLFIVMQVAMSRKTRVWVASAVFLPVIIAGLLEIYQYIADLASGNTVAQRISSDARATMWNKGLPAIIEKPIFGYGGGQSVNIAGIRGRLGFSTIDDYYLSLLLDAGILGAAALFAFVSIVGLAVLFSKGSQQNRRLRAGFFAGACAIFAGQKSTSFLEGMTYAFFFAGLVVASLQASGGLRLPKRDDFSELRINS